MKQIKQKSISWGEFMNVEMRVGTILDAQTFKKARNPSYILKVDFGNGDIRKSSAQITDLYSTKSLIGQQVIAVVNFPPKQIANIMSECLVLGSVGEGGVVTLIQPEQPVENGLRIG